MAQPVGFIVAPSASKSVSECRSKMYATRNRRRVTHLRARHDQNLQTGAQELHPNAVVRDAPVEADW